MGLDDLLKQDDDFPDEELITPAHENRFGWTFVDDHDRPHTSDAGPHADERAGENMTAQRTPAPVRTTD